MTRRELPAAVLGSAVAGGLGLFAGGQAWARIVAVRPEPLPPFTDVLSGSSAAPLVPAAGFVLLAGAVALVAVRGSGRVAVGLLVAGAGAALVWSGLGALTGGLEAAAVELPLVGGTPVVETSAVWPAVTVVAGLVGACAGLLTLVRGRNWPAMGRRYERAGAPSGDRAAASRPQTDDDRAQLAWQALDRGEDPTDPQSGRRS